MTLGGSGTPVILFWLTRNLYYLFMCLMLVRGRESDGETVKVKDAIPVHAARIRYSYDDSHSCDSSSSHDKNPLRDAGTDGAKKNMDHAEEDAGYDGITTLLTEHSISIYLDERDALRLGCPVELTLYGEEEEMRLTGTIVRIQKSRKENVPSAESAARSQYAVRSVACGDPRVGNLLRLATDWYRIMRSDKEEEKSRCKKMAQVYFIGAGPGDPELLTIKGKRIIDEADVIIYAGSLVNPLVLAGAKADAVIHNSAYMTLPEVIAVMEQAVREGKLVARVHTGDPSIYGAHREQMQKLDELGITYEIIPGVSSFLAAAAAMKREYTLPGVSQTVILTRMEGRTPMPEKEQIESLAAHQATMIIFLSVGEIEMLSRRLQAGGYPADTPAAVVYKASWEDQKIVTGTLINIADRVKEAGIRKTALVAVGHFLGDAFELSKLYDEQFATEFRKAKEK